VEAAQVGQDPVDTASDVDEDGQSTGPDAQHAVDEEPLVPQSAENGDLDAEEDVDPSETPTKVIGAIADDGEGASSATASSGSESEAEHGKKSKHKGKRHRAKGKYTPAATNTPDAPSQKTVAVPNTESTAADVATTTASKKNKTKKAKKKTKSSNSKQKTNKKKQKQKTGSGPEEREATPKPADAESTAEDTADDGDDLEPEPTAGSAAETSEAPESPQQQGEQETELQEQSVAVEAPGVSFSDASVATPTVDAGIVDMPATADATTATTVDSARLVVPVEAVGARHRSGGKKKSTRRSKNATSSTPTSSTPTSSAASMNATVTSSSSSSSSKRRHTSTSKSKSRSKSKSKKDSTERLASNGLATISDVHANSSVSLTESDTMSSAAEEDESVQQEREEKSDVVRDTSIRTTRVLKATSGGDSSENLVMPSKELDSQDTVAPLDTSSKTKIAVPSYAQTIAGVRNLSPRSQESPRKGKRVGIVGFFDVNDPSQESDSTNPSTLTPHSQAVRVSSSAENVPGNRFKSATMGARSGAHFLKGIELDRKKMEPEEFAKVYSQVRHSLRPTPVTPQEARAPATSVRQLDFRGTIKDTGWLAELLRRREGETVWQEFERAHKDGDASEASTLAQFAKSSSSSGRRQSDTSILTGAQALVSSDGTPMCSSAGDLANLVANDVQVSQSAQPVLSAAHQTRTSDHSTDAKERDDLIARATISTAPLSTQKDRSTRVISTSRNENDSVRAASLHLAPAVRTSAAADLSQGSPSAVQVSGSDSLQHLTDQELVVRWKQNRCRLAAAQSLRGGQGATSNAAGSLRCVQCNERERNILLLPCRHLHRCDTCQAKELTRCRTCESTTVGRLVLKYY